MFLFLCLNYVYYRQCLSCDQIDLLQLVIWSEVSSSSDIVSSVFQMRLFSDSELTGACLTLQPSM